MYSKAKNENSLNPFQDGGGEGSVDCLFGDSSLQKGAASLEMLICAVAHLRSVESKWHIG